MSAGQKGFQCSTCGHDNEHYLPSRELYQCSGCHKQHSVTSDTLFHSTKLPLKKWFWASYWISTDKGGISALRPTKLIGVSWPTARKMLKKLREAMGHRDSLYRLSDMIELDDALDGGKQKGKRGRGAKGKKPIIVACESKGASAGFLAIQAVDHINNESVDLFSKYKLKAEQSIFTDAFRGLTSLASTQIHILQVTPAEKVDEWLPWVHIVIGNLKRFILGTFNGVQVKYLQEYINEFWYRFNRRF